MAKEKKANKAKKDEKKGPIGKIIAVILVACLLLGTGVFFLVTYRKDTIKVAARSDVIKFWDEAGITKAFEDELHVRIKWLDYGAENEKVYAKMAEDLPKEGADLPDCYLGTGLELSQLTALTQQGAFLNLTNMAQDDKLMPNFSEVIRSDTARLPELMLDGGIYSLPAFQESLSEEYPQKAWINAEWLQRVGMQMPATTDELLAVLRKFQTEDCNRNGSAADEIPLGAAYGGQGNATTLGYLIHAFVNTDYDLADSNFLGLAEDGSVTAAVTGPGFRQALSYLRTLYGEGLLDQNVFQQGTEVFLGGSRANEKYGVILAKDLYALFNDTARAAVYVPLPPLKNGSQQGTLVRRSQVKLGGFLVPSRLSDKRQKLALRFGDAMLSEHGSLTVLYGAESVGWFPADNRIQAMGGAQATWRLADKAVDGTAIYGAIRGELPYWMSADRKLAQQATPDQNGSADLLSPLNWQGYLNQVTRQYYEPIGRACLRYELPELILTAEQSEELNNGSDANVYSDLIDTLNKTSREFVTGAKNLDGDWDAFVKTMNDKGLSKLVQYMQQALEKSRAG
ncbi:MAG: extracellular solute-binding protein [Oscillospiraceae bacterium]|jgi:putative aldouronate transport system substrate-binding protein|nr:extracellular solute-binding protein [Oscillospiraceae bacterium]